MKTLNWDYGCTIPFKTKKEAQERKKLHKTSKDYKYKDYRIDKDINGYYTLSFKYTYFK